MCNIGKRIKKREERNAVKVIDGEEEDVFT
jgi:hypothetical protein